MFHPLFLRSQCILLLLPVLNATEKRTSSVRAKNKGNGTETVTPRIKHTRKLDNWIVSDLLCSLHRTRNLIPENSQLPNFSMRNELRSNNIINKSTNCNYVRGINERNDSMHASFHLFHQRIRIYFILSQIELKMCKVSQISMKHDPGDSFHRKHNDKNLIRTKITTNVTHLYVQHPLTRASTKLKEK